MARSYAPTRLFINGDDFGLTPGVNEAIQQLYGRGRLTSASILVNSPWSDDAFRYARENPGLRIGVHLNLTTYAPVLPPEQVPTLVDGDGRFYPAGPLVLRLLSGRVNLDELAAELDAQVAECVRHGVQPVHADSHMHLHALPAVRQAVAAVARRNGIRIVRTTDPLALLLPQFGDPGPLQVAVRAPVEEFVRTRRRRTVDRRASVAGSFKSAERVVYLRWCVEWGEDAFATFLRCVERPQGGTIEVITHPAVPDDHLPALSGYVAGRERELALLAGEEFAQLLAEGWVQLG